MSNAIGADSTIQLPQGFHFNQVEHVLPPGTQTLATLTASAQTPALGPLADFAGNWTGSGFNTIFRPSRTPGTDNVLELNLTNESLSFSAALGAVPNRGMVQDDVFLNGVSYLQTINDVTDPAHTVGIHVEPGLWMMVPSTTNPAEGPTVVRMGSIPHGTTIQAQGTATTFAGAPTIPAVDITPFFIANGQKQPFASQTAATPNQFRIPQNLSSFIQAGTITQAIMNDPNTVLRNAIAKQKIVSTTQISIHTNPPSPPTAPSQPTVGGGTDNIAFLTGSPQPNAQAVQIMATFWIETVEHTIPFPVFHAGQPPIVLTPDPGVLRPELRLVPSGPILNPHPITFTTKQIQYSQTVLLNFNGLSWPHVSVGTLVPSHPVTVNSWAFGMRSPVSPGLLLRLGLPGLADA